MVLKRGMEIGQGRVPCITGLGEEAKIREKQLRHQFCATVLDCQRFSRLRTGMKHEKRKQQDVHGGKSQEKGG
jgi:hypothetical protein